MINLPNFVVRDSLLNPLDIELLPTDLKKNDEERRYSVFDIHLGQDGNGK
jgi:hypothetical protein